MPNGGIDNCGECDYNQVNIDGLTSLSDRKKNAYCIIRKTVIRKPFYTYCNNFSFNLKKQSPIPEGPIYSSGFYDDKIDHVRIPWHNKYEPQVNLPGNCCVCNQAFENGIELDMDSEGIIHFCCNAHYIQWWKYKHPNEILLQDCYFKKQGKDIKR